MNLKKNVLWSVNKIIANIFKVIILSNDESNLSYVLEKIANCSWLEYDAVLYKVR